jgi:hypothetical protein
MEMKGTEFLVEKPEGNRSLERLRRRREDNINMGFKEIVCMCIEFKWFRTGPMAGFCEQDIGLPGSKNGEDLPDQNR